VGRGRGCRRAHLNRPRVTPDDEARFSAREHKRQFFWAAFTTLTFNGISGDYAEFGCYGGVTFALAHEQIAHPSGQVSWQPTLARHMWAFDSFSGLPPSSGPDDDHPLWRPGVFAMDEESFHRVCDANGIPRDAYTAVPGYYEESLGAAAPSDAPNDIALAYIDCDMYSSARSVLEYLRPRLKHGMILAFDDYFCFSSERVAGEKLAFEELVAGETAWRFERYRDIGWAGASFVVESNARG
jgi:O-methyltransferase